MKQAKTVIREADDLSLSDEYEYYAEQCRDGEISRATYYRACKMTGLSRSEAKETLKHSYDLAGLGHLF